MGKLFNGKLWRIISAVAGILLAALIGASVWTTHYPSVVHSALHTNPTKIIKVEEGETVDTNYFPNNGMTLNEWLKAEEDMTKTVQAGGTVLLKNEKNALPLAKGAKVSVFGYNSVKAYSTGKVNGKGANGGNRNPEPFIELKEAVDASGGKIVMNPELYNYYSGKSSANLQAATYVPVDISDIGSVRSSYASYKDAAIVVIGRSGNEGTDLISALYSNDTNRVVEDYLALQPDEEEMLKEVTANFDKVIAIVNSSYAMELGWLEEYGIDAAVMVGEMGYSGWDAVLDILIGTTNPSGKTVDTYATNAKSAPAMVNFGDYTYANADAITETVGRSANATKYVVEKEGIYVGYKYYETRYEDSILAPNRNASSAAGAFVGNTWNYDDEVIYPFGYGLSYNTFEQKLDSVKESRDGYTYEVKVTVTCTEDHNGLAGRNVVQVYAQTPYNGTKGVEVSAIQLVGYGKTKELKKGESNTVTVTVKKEDLAHYDAFGAGTYIFEKGDYYIAIGDDAHDALNNVIEVKDASKVDGNASKVYHFNQKDTDTKNFSVERTTGAEIKNLFDDIDLNYWMKDHVTYLSRSNWQSTWPTEETSLSATADMIKALSPIAQYEAGSGNQAEIDAVTPNNDVTFTAASMRGVDFDNEIWDQFLDQLSIDDYTFLVCTSGITGLDKISKPTVFKKDGAHSVAANAYIDDKGETTTIMSRKYPSEVIMAASFDDQLLYDIGIAYGEANIRTNATGRYTPSVNIHRTPYSGRNFEYFSEDGFLTGEMAARMVEGMQEKGVIPFIKHLFGNEQETNRQGVSTFMTQQAAREIYLEGFKSATVDAKIKGFMSGFNRIGCTWTNASPALQNDLLRVEWGSIGVSDTDAGGAGADTAYMSLKAGVYAGTSMWASTRAPSDALKDIIKSDVELAKKAREAAHIILYHEVNSLGYNGIAPSDRAITVTVWWQSLLLALEIIFGIFTAAGIALAVYSEIRNKKD